MTFSNLYYKRTAATAKACYVCYKPTTTVLATINTTDFLYTCPGHLTDTNFATSLGENDDVNATKKLGVNAEDIAKVKEEWEERQKIKLEKEREKEKVKDKEKEEKEKNDREAGEKDKDGEKQAASKIPGTHSPAPPTPPSAPAATHQRYILHRDYYAMRLSVHRKRRQATRAKELAPRLPGAPRGAVTETF